MVLGVGGSTLYEIENAIKILESGNIVLMHGFQNYPTNYADINFGKTKKIMQLYPKFKHGYADHTAWDNENNILITLFGASLGMDFIEKHVSTHTGKARTDWQAAISIENFNELTKKLQIWETSFGNGLLELNEGEIAYSVFGPNKKAAILIRDVAKDEGLVMTDISFKRTGQVTDLSQLDIRKYIGKKFAKDFLRGHCLSKLDFH